MIDLDEGERLLREAKGGTGLQYTVLIKWLRANAPALFAELRDWERVKGYLLENWCMSPGEERPQVKAIMEVMIAARVATDEWKTEAQRLESENARLRGVVGAAKAMFAEDGAFDLTKDRIRALRAALAAVEKEGK